MMADSQHIYILRLMRQSLLIDGPTEAEAQCLREHGAYLERLSQAGTVLLAGRTQTTDESTFGLVILAESSAADATLIMKADPAITGGLMTGTLYPYEIAFVASDLAATTQT